MAKKGVGTARELKTRLKTARGRTTASTRWLERQLNDPYVAEARRKGYRSRAAFKLIGIEERYPFLKPGQRIVDLGAAPGGWSQIIANRIGVENPDADKRGRLVAIDLLDMDPITGVTIIKGDFLDDDVPDRLIAELGGAADAVVSDLAANTTGHRATDHLRIVALCEVALDFARQTLTPGGVFLAKVLQGGTEAKLLASMKRDFATVRHVKPPASRSDSAETYVLATGFRREPD